MGTYDPMPTDGSTGWGSHYRTAIGGLDTRVTTLESAAYSYLDSFSGSDDETRLTNALAYASAQTHKPIIKLANRAHTFTTQRTAYDGLKIEGTGGFNNPEKGQSFTGTSVTLSMSGAWITSSASTLFDLYLGRLAFIGSSTATVVGGGSTVWWCELFRDLSCSGLLSFAGTQASKHLMTACVWDGCWNISNCYTGAVHVGGSDCTLWPQGGLIDSGTAFNTAGSSQGQYHLWFDSMDKLSLGPVYITCEGGWGGIKISGQAYNGGGTNQGLVVAHGGMKVEGRNPTAACDGANIRVEGGMLHMQNPWIAYGMVSPSTMGHTPTDAGVVHVTAGRVIIDGAIYDRTSGQAETVPFVYVGGGSVRVSNVSTGSRGGTWTGLPRVNDVSGTSVTADNTVTVI